MHQKLINAFYAEKEEQYSSKFITINRQIKQIAWLRFFVFIAVIVLVVLFGFSNWLAVSFSVFLVFLFLFLVKKNIQLEKQKNRFFILKNIVRDELIALNHQFSHFPSGSEFLDTDHFFSFDLDLFGEGSLFQLINRTATKSGYKKLANDFINPSLAKIEIEKKQKAIQELANNAEGRLQFLADGKLFQETEELSEEIKNWSELNLALPKSGLIKRLIFIVPLLTLISAVPAITGYSNLFLIFMVFVQWMTIFAFWKTINQYFRFFGRKSELLAKYMQLLNFIEKQDFKAEYLLELQEKVKTPESASVVFSKLKSLVKEFEYRQNMLVGFVLNSVLLWDTRCVFRLWIWHQKNGTKLSVWLAVIAEFDALISLANYANNQDNFVYPKIEESGFVFNAKDLGHPLLHPEKRINNDLEINGWSKVLIVTGANMAGKSTFLRTVGINLLLARLGAPVCASAMQLTPTRLYTNMRTTDSLLKDESYFFAELKRIKGVLDQLQKGEKIFVILDEMLKGTNSVDKLNGSRELIRKLVEFKSVSLIATHDLKLSEMENEYPENVSNKCFEIRIENDELVFDYRLTNGVTKLMNASFLMRKMGII